MQNLESEKKENWRIAFENETFNYLDFDLTIAHFGKSVLIQQMSKTHPTTKIKGMIVLNQFLGLDEYEIQKQFLKTTPFKDVQILNH
jgi:hypothetical protein